MMSICPVSHQTFYDAKICEGEICTLNIFCVDYLAALLIDVDKQVDTARAVRLQHSRARPMRNVIKEQHVMNVLDDANFDTDEGLIDAVHLLGLVMRGFVDGLRVPNEDEEENETSEEE
ncbi:hypothetical protein DdX_21026 [Ditylenchus destructor]|uniref:Uncharacterized protein n=1 Tax=Ditylenchus destructor TaxID=166010 RepID=A0AAD4MJR4_9BILA|nr:hypothetical protein DdX_21026 [Ditylenchus destructor]